MALQKFLTACAVLSFLAGSGASPCKPRTTTSLAIIETSTTVADSATVTETLFTDTATSAFSTSTEAETETETETLSTDVAVSTSTEAETTTDAVTTATTEATTTEAATTTDAETTTEAETTPDAATTTEATTTEATTTEATTTEATTTEAATTEATSTEATLTEATTTDAETTTEAETTTDAATTTEATTTEATTTQAATTEATTTEAATTTSAAPVETNLLINPGFDDSASNYVPWVTGGAGGVFALDTTRVQAGSQSLKMGSQAGLPFSVTQVVDRSLLVPNAVYKLSLYAQVDNPSKCDPISLWMDVNSQLTAGAMVQAGISDMVNTWKLIEGEYTFTEAQLAQGNTIRARLQTTCSNNYFAWIDSAKLTLKEN